jgi:hypothetical protein
MKWGRPEAKINTGNTSGAPHNSRNVVKSGSMEKLYDTAVIFHETKRLEEFEEFACRIGYFPPHYVDDILARVGIRKRRK